MFDVADTTMLQVLLEGESSVSHDEVAHDEAEHDEVDAVARADALYGVMARATRGLFEVLLEVDRTCAWEGDGARDLAHWVQMRFGISAWKAHRWAAAAAALERLPRLGEALARGKLGVDKVVELTRFATPETEGGLVAWAASVSSGAIRRRADLEVKRPAEASAELDRERR
ncbi:MAG TPA: DUF222 domain-containing protein, partial [Actinomycetota bacterium]|nr:DUF222 domain-containing protein [Actinomycetota bacterium]